MLVEIGEWVISYIVIGLLCYIACFTGKNSPLDIEEGTPFWKRAVVVLLWPLLLLNLMLR